MAHQIVKKESHAKEWQGLHYDRPLGSLELLQVAIDNIGIKRQLNSSAHYHIEKPFHDAINDIVDALSCIVRAIPAYRSIVARNHEKKSLWRAHLPAETFNVNSYVSTRVVKSLDLEYDTFPKIVAETLDCTFTIDLLKPCWRVYILHESNHDGPTTNLRIAFEYSHVLMDGMCGPIFHQQLAEVLNDPNHILRSAQAVEDPTAITLPFEQVYSVQPTLWTQLNAFWTLFISVPVQKLCNRLTNRNQNVLRTWLTDLHLIVLNQSTCDRLKSRLKPYKLTLGNCLSVLATCAFEHILQNKELQEKSLIKLYLIFTHRQGYPAAQSLKVTPSIQSTTFPPGLSSGSGFFRTVTNMPGLRVHKRFDYSNILDMFKEQRDNAHIPRDILQNACGLAALRQVAELLQYWWSKNDLHYTGLEDFAALRFLKSTFPEKHLAFSNTGVVHLNQGDWTIGKFSWGISGEIVDVPGLFMAITGCGNNDGISLSITHNPTVYSAEQIATFRQVFCTAVDRLSHDDGRILSLNGEVEIRKALFE